MILVYLKKVFIYIVLNGLSIPCLHFEIIEHTKSHFRLEGIGFLC